jgi:hypothetical protein
MAAAGKVTHGAATPEGAPSPVQHASNSGSQNACIRGVGEGLGVGAPPDNQQQSLWRRRSRHTLLSTQTHTLSTTRAMRPV